MFSLKNLFSKPTFEDTWEKWNELERLEHLRTVLKNFQCGIAFVQDDDGIVKGYTLAFGDDHNHFESDLIDLDWPMQYMPMPEAFQDKVT